MAQCIQICVHSSFVCRNTCRKARLSDLFSLFVKISQLMMKKFYCIVVSNLDKLLKIVASNPRDAYSDSVNFMLFVFSFLDGSLGHFFL